MSIARNTALALAMLTATAAMAQTPQQPGAGSFGNNIVMVRTARMGASVSLGGAVVPYKEVTMTAQIPGRVEYIAGREGDWFDEGAVLVAINDDELLAKRRQIQAEIANAESALRNAQVQYNREMWSPQSRSTNRLPGMGVPSLFDQMFTRGAGSMMGYDKPGLERQADLYSSGSRITEAQSQVMQARSMLEGLDAKLKDTRSVAPFGGVIVQKHVEVGDTVQPGQPLLSFADTKYLQIKVDVPARLMPGLQKGMIVPAKLDVGDTRLDVRVAQIFPMADVQRHTVTVKFDLPVGAPGGPGMYAEVMIPDVNVEARETPVIPTSALVYRGSLPAVFVINADNRTELRMVRIGSYLDSYTVSVLSGVQAGERVLMNPPAGMASGWSAGGGPQQPPGVSR
ncbi:efflux RND transporter periplasmic adaptor subunit [Thioalbus denitrificans]|uniref:RND family efflux transporter MFP subunit n=1 Tax=Thioalbus denitrificans TaxID=547122 RepID=A0A369CL19_9GAMM|nr:efflux RND transporter periplasmic adaptor subunit [Thioalbus denitrificans]RCX33127.1 RND family efflux transporter MFP subunit [Thioalbus denitrificans]